jgi:integrase
VYITALTYLSECYDYKKSFRDMTDKDVADFIDGLHREEDVDPDQSSVTTQNTFAGPISKFYRWLYRPDLSPAQRRKIPKHQVPGIRLLVFPTKTGPKSPTKEKDKWTDQDFAICLKYLDYDVRLACFIAMERDTACRPHELLRLTLKDVEDEIYLDPDTQQEYAEIWIPSNTKKNKGRKVFPMVYSIKNFYVWKQQHPKSDDPEAPIFMSREWSAKYREDGPVAVSEDSIRQDMKRLYQYLKIKSKSVKTPKEDKAKLEKLLARQWFPRVLRLSSLQLWRKTGIDEYHFRQCAGWGKNSKMIEVYTDEEDNIEASDHALMIRYGINAKDKKQQQQQQEVEQELKGRTCHNCGASNMSHASTCIRCEKPLDPLKIGVLH